MKFFIVSFFNSLKSSFHHKFYADRTTAPKTPRTHEINPKTTSRWCHPRWPMFIECLEMPGVVPGGSKRCPVWRRSVALSVERRGFASDLTFFTFQQRFKDLIDYPSSVPLEGPSSGHLTSLGSYKTGRSPLNHSRPMRPPRNRDLWREPEYSAGQSAVFFGNTGGPVPVHSPSPFRVPLRAFLEYEKRRISFEWFSHVFTPTS